VSFSLPDTFRKVSKEGGGWDEMTARRGGGGGKENTCVGKGDLGSNSRLKRYKPTLSGA